MTVAVNTSGSQVATVTTEHTLATIATAGVFVIVVDAAAMILADFLELRAYGKARSTDTERLLFRSTYAHIQTCPLLISVPIVSPHHLKVTLKQSAGTSRTFPWAVYNT